MRGVKYGRRLRRGFVAWAVAAAGIRLFVAQPEHCATVTDASLRHAIDETIAWATRTQGEDGRWIYRYDTVTDSDVAAYEMVRHAGLILTLNQAAAAGFDRRACPRSGPTRTPGRFSCTATIGSRSAAAMPPG